MQIVTLDECGMAVNGRKGVLQKGGGGYPQVRTLLTLGRASGVNRSGSASNTSAVTSNLE